MPTWWPACKVRLKIRLENPGGALTPPTPSEGDTDAGAESFGSGSLADIIETAQREFVQIGDDIVPKSCTIELNNYRKADTAKITLELRRLPIDPRLVRAMTVQLFGGTIDPGEWAAGQRGPDGVVLPDLPTALTGVATSFGGATNELFRGFADKHRIVVNEREQTVEIEARDLTGEMLDAEIPPNMLRDLPGFLRLDEAVQLLLTGDGLAGQQTDPRIEEQRTRPLGRNRRRLLSRARSKLADAADFDAEGNTAAAAAARVEAAQLQAQATALKQQGAAADPRTRRFGLPGFRGLSVVNEVIDPATGQIEPLPTVDEIRPKAWLDSSGKTRKGRKRGAGNTQKISFWDFIADMVTGAGFIVFVRPPASQQLVAVEIVISNPRTYYRESTSAGELTPPPTSTRTLTYGENVEELTLERNLKGTAVPTIQVNGFDASTGERYSGFWPPLGKNNRPTPTGDGDRNEIKVINAAAVTGGSPDEVVANLTRAAAAVYEQLARGDFEVNVKTRSLSALPEHADRGIVGDLFALRPKDPIQVTLPAQDPTTGVVSSALILDDTNLATRIEQARQAGLSEETAIQLGQAAASNYVQREFRTRMFTLVWNSETGWDLTIGAINYLDVRDSIQVTEAQSGLVPG